ncbi:MAG TPA: N-methyl-L-tryptophan oxidase [Rhizomicrobium sp.]|jgi:sarcosine oxidase
MKVFDVAVLGLGALGSAALLQLTRRGVHVVGIDRFSPPHDRGSSHGGTRITRSAIGEGEHYTPLALRSHALWREIEQQTGETLLTSQGLLVISGAARTSFTHVENFYANTLAAAHRYGIAHEILDADEIRRRYNQFRIRDDEIGYYEPGAGYLRPEACIAAQLALARRNGAEIRTHERVLRFALRAADVLVTTDKESYVVKTLLLAAGPWLPELLDDKLAQDFRVFRQAMFWFADPAGAFRADRFPVFIWELAGRSQSIYGFPDIDGTGVKVATEQYVATTAASSVDREIGATESVAMHETYVAPFLPELSATCTRAATCLYTVTADFGFVVDRHPDSENVIVASCCSGHGFKHSAALGEALAEVMVNGRSTIDLRPFALKRLSVH